MKFELEKANYNLKNIDFLCDNKLANDIREPFPNTSFFMCIVGRPGSGKTTLLMQILTQKGENKIYYQVFNKIHLVMPVTSRDSLKNNEFNTLPDEQKHNEFNDNVIKSIYNCYEESKEKKKKNF